MIDGQVYHNEVTYHLVRGSLHVCMAKTGPLRKHSAGPADHQMYSSTSIWNYHLDIPSPGKRLIILATIYGYQLIQFILSV